MSVRVRGDGGGRTSVSLCTHIDTSATSSGSTTLGEEVTRRFLRRLTTCVRVRGWQRAYAMSDDGDVGVASL